MTSLPSELRARQLRTEEHLQHLRREAEVARLLRLAPRRAWQLRLWGWTLRLERTPPRSAVG